MKYDTVIYINFSQYDNAGRILDYLRERFGKVIHFSFDHLRLKNGRKTNLITVYDRGKITYQNRLYSLRVPEPLLFPSLPLVGLIMVYQSIRHSLKLSRRGRTVFFTVNAFPALIGMVLKKLGIVDKTYFWVWDYFPTAFPDWRLKLIRMYYMLCDRLAVGGSDRLIFPNRRQLSLRFRNGTLPDHARIIPLGSSRPVTPAFTHSVTAGFLGMLKENQGVYLIFEHLAELFAANPELRLEIIGSGPEEEYFRTLAEPFNDRIRFHGFIPDDNEVDKIVKSWFAGFAVYKPVPENESYWGDPSKIKTYLSRGVPVITTDVTDFGAVCRKEDIGICIPYEPKAICNAVRTIYTRQSTYRKTALAYGKRFYYRKLYKSMFDPK